MKFKTISLPLSEIRRLLPLTRATVRVPVDLSRCAFTPTVIREAILPWHGVLEYGWYAMPEDVRKPRKKFLLDSPFPICAIWRMTTITTITTISWTEKHDHTPNNHAPGARGAASINEQPNE